MTTDTREQPSPQEIPPMGVAPEISTLGLSGKIDPTGWCVVCAKASEEAVAERSISALGYEPWCPVYGKRLRGARITEEGRRVRSRTDGIEDRPLFPGYLFALIPYGDGGSAIDAARGVRRLLRHPHTGEGWGKPKIIRARFILQIREWVDAGLWENEHGRIVPVSDISKPRDDLAIGDSVRTPTGIVATLLTLDDRGRADLLADMMGANRIIRGADAATLELVHG